MLKFRGNHLTQINHLISEDFITMEITSEKSSVAIGSIETFVDGDIRVLTEVVMHGGILSISRVQVSSSVLISSVFSDYGLEHIHGEEFRVGVSGSIIDDTDVQIGHFIISHIQGRGGEVRSFHVGLFGLSGG